MRKIGTILVIGAAVLSSVMFTARANANGTAVCRQSAKADYKACTAECKSDFIDAKLTCRNILPSCGEACLAGRQACFDDVDAIKDTGQLPGGATLDNCSGGTDACKAALDAGRQTCGAPCNGDATCISCMDPFQLADFMCRDACRDSFRTNAIVIADQAACRNTFQACVHACPPAN